MTMLRLWFAVFRCRARHLWRGFPWTKAARERQEREAQRQHEMMIAVINAGSKVLAEIFGNMPNASRLIPSAPKSDEKENDESETLN